MTKKLRIINTILVLIVVNTVAFIRHGYNNASIFGALVASVFLIVYALFENYKLSYVQKGILILVFVLILVVPVLFDL